MLKESFFYGKVLLFGEYGIIQNSMGLSIPFESYQGSLIFSSDDKKMAEWSNNELRKFYSFLLDLNCNKFFSFVCWIKCSSWSLHHSGNMCLLLDLLISNVCFDLLSQSSNFFSDSLSYSFVNNFLNALS